MLEREPVPAGETVADGEDVPGGDPGHVTMLFSDIEGSTSMVARLGGAWIDVLATHRRLCRAAWARWGGTEMGTEGDSFFVVFDDPTPAVRAAVTAQEAISSHAWRRGEEVRIRIGIHTGPVARHEDGYVGLDVHRAARVCSAAHGGQTLMSGTVHALVRDRLGDALSVQDLGSHRLKDIPEPVRLFQVAAVGHAATFPHPRSVGAPEVSRPGVADYRFLRSLGESSHGSLFVAVPPARLGLAEDLVIVKVIAGVAQEATLRRATRELRAFARVSSPFLVTPLDAGRQGDAYYYAVEYCELGSLEAPEVALDRGSVLAVMAQAARGVHALHEAGLVHRGVKPSTVLLTARGARVADFGLVQPLEPTTSVTSLGSMSAVDFVEPSLLSGEPGGPASDIWSLAATMHWGLTRQGLYGVLPADDPLFCVRKVLTSPARLSPALHESDADLIARCLEPDRSHRPSTALELAVAIEALPRD